MSPLELLAVAGTRPEALKLAPVLLRVRRERGLRARLLAAGQHGALLDSALAAFGLRPDLRLGAMRPAQEPGEALERVRAGVRRALERAAPDLVLVQGDTASALGAALAAFERGVPVAHLEAGLRTGDPAAPYPEELYRVMIDRLARVHLAPTARARRALRAEKRPDAGIYVTGNTAVDALLSAPPRPAPRPRPGRRLAVLTLHRRESHGAPLRGLLRAVAAAARRLPGLDWICPVHPNPAVRAAYRALPRGGAFRLVRPMPYPEFTALLRAAALAVTDSGGIQEEAPTLGLRFVLLRAKTERPEALGRWGALAGLEPAAVERAIIAAASKPRPPRGPNPFGDGRAAERVVAAIKHWAGLGPRPRDFAARAG